jgi:hypothetical protein
MASRISIAVFYTTLFNTVSDNAIWRKIIPFSGHRLPSKLQHKYKDPKTPISEHVFTDAWRARHGLLTPYARASVLIYASTT